MPIPAHIRFLRFYATPSDENLCWEWTGGLFKTSGYGKFNAGVGRTRNLTVYAHRYSWQLANGPIPKGLQVLHRCDNRKCVRPSHLFIGTQQDNVDDMFAKGRARVGSQCKRARLTEQFVAELRANHSKSNTRELAEVARQHGVSYGTIYDAVRRITWRHV